jgi:uncharacterized protein
VDRLKHLYRELGKSVFVNKIWRKGILAPKFPFEPVQRALDAQLGAETTLDSDHIRTGLMIMTKRLDTGSPSTSFVETSWKASISNVAQCMCKLSE